MRVSQHVKVLFSISQYHDKIACDVLPMEARHLSCTAMAIL